MELRLSFVPLVLLIALVAAGPTLAQNGAAAMRLEQLVITRVVDGDTVEVRIGDRLEKVRLIGVDTPESVHPFRPVEYFAKEAAEFTRKMAEGKPVRMTGEAGTADRDRYGRLLRYVYLPDGRLLNAEIIAQGYGFAFVKYPFGRMEEFRALERMAREKGLGRWAEPQEKRAPDLGVSATKAGPP